MTDSTSEFFSLDKVRGLAGEELPAESKMRMLIASFAAANWMALMMLLLLVGDLTPPQQAIELAVGVSGIVFAAYFVLSRLPAIARGILLLFGEVGR